MNRSLVSIARVAGALLVGAGLSAAGPADALEIHRFDPARLHVDAKAGQGPRRIPGLRPGAHCGTEVPSLLERELVERDLASFQAMAALEEPSGERVSTHVVEVVFHVLHDGEQGLLSTDDLLWQVEALNAAYAGSGLAFEAVWADELDDPDFFEVVKGSEAELVVKSVLSADWDPRYFLNLYTGVPISEDGSELLGYATFPWNLAAEPELDGVVINYQTFPGGVAPYDEGDTTVHEVGHWVGLYHTFQGGCAGAGDSVKDTPPEAYPDYECALGRNTCPSKGSDSITNYMNYGQDWCLVTFSKGQKTRFKGMVSRYRSRL